MEAITIETKIEPKEFQKLLRRILFKNNAVQIIYILGIGYSLWCLIAFIWYLNAVYSFGAEINNSQTQDPAQILTNNLNAAFTNINDRVAYLQNHSGDLTNVICILVFLLLIPLLINKVAKRSKRIFIKTTYTFTNELVMNSGETFKTESKWVRFSKIKEMGNWFLFYLDNSLVYPIKKEAFTLEQLGKFRELLKTTKGPLIEIEGYTNKPLPDSEGLE